MTAAPVPLDTATVPCRANPESMFPTSTGPRRQAEEAAAKAVCRTGDNGRACHAIDVCLAYAMRFAVEGVWAATTTEERQAIRERAGVVPLPVIVSPYTQRIYDARRNGAA